MNRPIVFVAGLFASGIWAERIIHLPFYLLSLITCLLVIVSILTYKKNFLSNIFLLVSIIFLGCIFYVNTKTHPQNHIKNFVSIKKEQAVLRGVIVTNPQLKKTDYGGEKVSFTLSASRLKTQDTSYEVSGQVSVSIFGEDNPYHYGDEVVLEGVLSAPKPPTNPGQFDYRQYLYNQNIYATFKAGQKDSRVLIADTGGIPILKFCYRLRYNLRQILKGHISPDAAGFMNAILLGDRSYIEEALKEAFIKTGTVHILAISGLHIGIVAFIIFTVFKALRIPRKSTLILTIVVLVIYALITGANAPVVRSTIMVSVFLIGMLIAREADILNSLGLSALTILLVKPLQLFDPGFQLSFMSVGSIVLLAPRINSILQRFIPHFYISNAISASLSAWFGILPVVAYYFNIVSTISLIANIIIVPLLGAMLASGISLIIVSLLLKPVAVVFANTTSFLILSLTKIAYIFSDFPFAYFRLPKPSISTMLIYYCLLFLIFEYRRLRLSKARVLIVLLVTMNIFLFAGTGLTKRIDSVKVTFLDVGHGDSIFVEFPNKGCMLVDGGDKDTGRALIAPFLWNKGIARIDILVLTHPEQDHIGGLLYVLNNFDVGLCIDNGMETDTEIFREYIKAIKHNATPRLMLQGEHIIEGVPFCKLKLLHPDKDLLHNTASDFNNNSVVLKLTFKERSLLLCGDIEEEGLLSLVRKKDELKADIIKVPHHGSALNEIGRLFFNTVKPKIAIISIDDDNRLGLPHQSTLNALKESGARVYTTADYGAIEIDL